MRAAKVLKDKGFENFELWVAGQIAATSDSHKYEKELRMYAKEHLEGVLDFWIYFRYEGTSKKLMWSWYVRKERLLGVLRLKL